MEKRIEFACSQEELFETVMNLANQGQWPLGWSYRDLGARNSLGFIDLEVSRERVLKQRELPGSPPRTADVQFFGKAGMITFAGTDKHNSALIVRSENPFLLKFFDDLVHLVSGYRPPKALGARADPARIGVVPGDARESPYVPKYKKWLNNWKAVWQTIKYAWKHGASYQELAKSTKLSAETVAAIVKAGDAGLLD